MPTHQTKIPHIHSFLSFFKPSYGYKLTQQTPLMASSSVSLSTSLRTLSTSSRRFCRPYTPLLSPQLPFNFKKFNYSIAGLRGVRDSIFFRTDSTRSDCRTKASSAAGMTTEATTEKKQVVEVFDSEEDLAVSLAKYTADLSEKFTKERGSFTVVLSGGSLIKSLRKLVEPPYIDSVEWSKWHVLWVDERVVPKDHVDSNYKLAFDGFLCQVPILPGNVYAINDALSAEGAADDYETCLKHLVNMNVLDRSSVTGFPKFDLMLLGMGPDGHVASLFPGHHLVKENEKWVTCIKDSPKPPPERITFTFPVINSSAYIALVVCGAGKADAVQRALGKNQSFDVLPVQMVSPDGELKWFLDKNAASKL